MVLKDNQALIHDPRGKFKPNWTGPYIIKAIWLGGAIILMDLDGLEFSKPINMDKLKNIIPKRLARLKTRKGNLGKSRA
ncbi:hypothetical protein ACSBR2_035162 [Camellia fascicularis]